MRWCSTWTIWRTARDSCLGVIRRLRRLRRLIRLRWRRCGRWWARPFAASYVVAFGLWAARTRTSRRGIICGRHEGWGGLSALVFLGRFGTWGDAPGYDGGAPLALMFAAILRIIG